MVIAQALPGYDSIILELWVSLELYFLREDNNF